MIPLSRAVNSVASGVVINTSEDRRLLGRQNRLFNTGFKRIRRMAISPVPTSGVTLPETSTYRHNIRESSVHRSHLQSILLTYAAGEYSPILRSTPDGPSSTSREPVLMPCAYSHPRLVHRRCGASCQLPRLRDPAVSGTLSAHRIISSFREPSWILSSGSRRLFARCVL